MQQSRALGKWMIYIRDMNIAELEEAAKMGKQDHVIGFLNKKSFATHKTEFESDDHFYLSILNKVDSLLGYVIVRKEKEADVLQLKRILIDEKYLGIGQQAITLVENYCIENFSCKRIWLDVYESNTKAIHIYKKLGYLKIKEELQKFRWVQYYEKWL